MVTGLSFLPTPALVAGFNPHAYWLLVTAIPYCPCAICHCRLFTDTNTTDHCYFPVLLPPRCLELGAFRFWVSPLYVFTSSNGHAS